MLSMDLNNQEETFICSCCNGKYPMDERKYVEGEQICNECYNETAVVCACCGTSIWTDDNAGDSETPLCGRCFERYYTTCERCRCVISVDNVLYDDDRVYCPDCYNHYNMDAIHEYSYKPSPIFYGDENLYLGIELEIDEGGKSGENAYKILELANRNDECVYIKSDSSLAAGMEIVSHPCSLEYHITRLPWRDIVKKALDMGYFSHDTSTCGLHIHVNRSAFTDDYEKQEDCIGRILFFMEKHWEKLLNFSRRTEVQLDRWARRYGFKGSPKEVLDYAKKGGAGRYTALNLENHSTIEFRIFRGTLKYNTLIAAMQLVNEICIAAIFMSDQEISTLSWNDFVKGIKAPELIGYLRVRKLYIDEEVEDREEDEYVRFIRVD